MHCKINIEGDLVVEAQSETEAFALERWVNNYEKGEYALKLIVKPIFASWYCKNNIIRFLKREKI